MEEVVTAIWVAYNSAFKSSVSVDFISENISPNYTDQYYTI